MNTRLHVLILQHPQEPGETLGTANLAAETLENATLRTGLSWPNLKAALGKNHPLAESIRPQEWGVLYLGTGLGQNAKGQRPARPAQKGAGPTPNPSGESPASAAGEDLILPDGRRVSEAQAEYARRPKRNDRLVILKDGRTPTAKSFSPMRQEEIISELKGIVILDGTWKQAKTMWWRNAWLLKLRRIVLIPERPSLYGRMRREPRRECLSTIESIGVALEQLGEGPEVREALFDRLSVMLKDRARGRRPDASGPEVDTSAGADSDAGSEARAGAGAVTDTAAGADAADACDDLSHPPAADDTEPEQE